MGKNCIDIAKALRNDHKMKCFCDLDRWEPERTTGHSCVCPIHKLARRIEAGLDPMPKISEG